MVAFIVVPLFLVVYFAFTSEEGGFTLDNLVKISQYTPIFVKSINLAIIATLICFVLAYPIAYILSRSTERYQRTMILLVMLPMWMNFLLRTYGWMTLLENEGLINKFLGLLHIGPFQMINTAGAVVLGMVYNYLPFMILPLYSVMAKIDQSMIEAAQDLGCNAVKVIIKVLMPLSLPGIITGVTMVFVPSVSTFVISRMLGGGQNMLIGDLIEQQFIGSTYNPYVGSAMSLILMVIMLVIMGIMSSFDDDEMEGLVI
ncbi:ABC transporter permease [Massiliimalia massiliensis]|uniref:ABC transporter permease n=1 Tax=Massiliimalia massiliensis TaxID=1852384 RepID=UPI0009862199|nr:ABC transporter permease [Massiliimalia massiliensis]